MRGPNATEDLGAAAEPLPTMMPTGGPSTWRSGRRIYRGDVGRVRRGCDGKRGPRAPEPIIQIVDISPVSNARIFSAGRPGSWDAQCSAGEGTADTGADPTQSWVPRVRIGRNSKQPYCCASIGRHLWWLDALLGGFRVWRSMTVDVVAAAVKAHR